MNVGFHVTVAFYNKDRKKIAKLVFHVSEAFIEEAITGVKTAVDEILPANLNFKVESATAIKWVEEP